jgi:hypothetical protein
MMPTVDVNLGSIDGLGDIPVVDPPELPPGYYPPGWYDGVFYPTGFFVPAGLPTDTVPAPWSKLEVNFGDTVRFNLSYKYRGPGGKSFTLYAAVGSNYGGGGEWSGFAESKGIYPPESTDWRTITDSIDLVMGQAGYPTHSGEDGAVYFKIENFKSPAYLNAIHVLEAAGEFQNLTISSLSKV